MSMLYHAAASLLQRWLGSLASIAGAMSGLLPLAAVIAAVFFVRKLAAKREGQGNGIGLLPAMAVLAIGYFAVNAWLGSHRPMPPTSPTVTSKAVELHRQAIQEHQRMLFRQRQLRGYNVRP